MAENEIAIFSVQSETYAHPNYTFESAAAIDITSLWYSFHICISKMRWPCPDSTNWYRQELSFSLEMTENKGMYRYGLLSYSTEIWHSGKKMDPDIAFKKIKVKASNNVKLLTILLWSLVSAERYATKISCNSTFKV